MVKNGRLFVVVLQRSRKLCAVFQFYFEQKPSIGSSKLHRKMEVYHRTQFTENSGMRIGNIQEEVAPVAIVIFAQNELPLLSFVVEGLLCFLKSRKVQGDLFVHRLSTLVFLHPVDMHALDAEEFRRGAHTKSQRSAAAFGEIVHEVLVHRNGVADDQNAHGEFPSGERRQDRIFGKIADLAVVQTERNDRKPPCIGRVNFRRVFFGDQRESTCAFSQSHLLGRARRKAYHPEEEGKNKGCGSHETCKSGISGKRIIKLRRKDREKI